MNGLLAAIPILMAAPGGLSWTPIEIKGAELHLEMPKVPTPSQVQLNGQRSFFYTCDAAEGRFVAGYTPIPPVEQNMVRRGIAIDPGSPGILSLMASTVAAFAKGGGAKVAGENVGIDKGLPAEYATLKNDQMTLRMRVYLCSKRLYVFAVSTDVESAARFFDSVRMPPEIRRH